VAPGQPAAPLATSARLGAVLGGHLPAPGARIGLLGGSFNPAHRGHVTVSEQALVRLGLDEVWWLVSPRNPLKPSRGLAPLADRLAGAKALANRPGIRACALESALGTYYSIDTVEALTQRFPRVHFVWIIGADNLIQLPRWKDWQRLFNTVVVAVFDRPSYSLRALAAKAARRFAGHRLPESRARQLAAQRPPAWVFVHGRLDSRSSTAIRGAGRR
jgi:nicotinate-nucleotide adenylyltransferase